MRSLLIKELHFKLVLLHDSSSGQFHYNRFEIMSNKTTQGKSKENFPKSTENLSKSTENFN